MGQKTRKGIGPPIASIVEEERVRHALNDAHLRWPRINDAWEAITWAVVHDPAVGTPVTESGKTRAVTLHGARSINMPDVTIIYVADPPFLTVCDILIKESTMRYVPQIH